MVDCIASTAGTPSASRPVATPANTSTSLVRGLTAGEERQPQVGVIDQVGFQVGDGRGLVLPLSSSSARKLAALSPMVPAPWPA